MLLTAQISIWLRDSPDHKQIMHGEMPSRMKIQSSKIGLFGSESYSGRLMPGSRVRASSGSHNGGMVEWFTIPACHAVWYGFESRYLRKMLG